jgi:hypothetical protein
MKEIPLTQGKVALVDDEDYPELAGFKWCYHERRVNHGPRGWGYAQRRILKGEPNFPGHISMHQIIVSRPDWLCIDHINGDGIDNRKENLRVVTLRENSRNQTHRKSKLSKYIGVSASRCRKNPWRAAITLKGIVHYLGAYPDEITAATVYRVACAVLT